MRPYSLGAYQIRNKIKAYIPNNNPENDWWYWTTPTLATTTLRTWHQIYLPCRYQTPVCIYSFSSTNVWLKPYSSRVIPIPFKFFYLIWTKLFVQNIHIPTGDYWWKTCWHQQQIHRQTVLPDLCDNNQCLFAPRFPNKLVCSSFSKEYSSYYVWWNILHRGEIFFIWNNFLLAW